MTKLELKIEALTRRVAKLERQLRVKECEVKQIGFIQLNRLEDPQDIEEYNEESCKKRQR